MKNWKWVLRLFRGSRMLYLAAFLLMVIAILAGYATPQIIRFTVDNVLGLAPVESGWMRLLSDTLYRLGVLGQPQAATTLGSAAAAGSAAAGAAAAPMGQTVGAMSPGTQIWVLGALSLAVSILGGLANFLRGRVTAVACEGFTKRLRDLLFSHIQFMPYAWHVQVQTGDIIQRCTADVDVLRNFLQGQLLEMLRTVLMVVIAYTVLFPMNFRMAFVSLLFLPVILAYSYFFLKGVSWRFLKADEAEGQLMSIAQENFTGVRVVRAFGRERQEIDRFDAQNRTLCDLWVKLGDLLGIYWGVGDIFSGVQTVSICTMGAFEAVAGRISVGGFMVFIIYSSLIIWPVRNLGRILSEAGKTGVSLGRLAQILDAPMEGDAPGAGEYPVGGDIVFDHVTFSYAGTDTGSTGTGNTDAGNTGTGNTGAVSTDAGNTDATGIAMDAHCNDAGSTPMPLSIRENPPTSDLAADVPDATGQPTAVGEISSPRKILDDVSFTVKEGETLGILGGTGSGKSTLAHLLCRLYDLDGGHPVPAPPGGAGSGANEAKCTPVATPGASSGSSITIVAPVHPSSMCSRPVTPSGGSITIGGRPIEQFGRRWLRRHIGIVLQEPYLYSHTIRENIASLDPGIPLEDVREAARIADIDSSIEEFEKGYDTMVGERGVTLSGGQKQRIAIARAIVKRPPILVFDDSLSAVDTQTDARIRSSLKERVKGTTTLLIAYRVTSLSLCDRILVLQDGRVAETGTHDELMALGGIYRKTYEMQESDAGMP